MDFYVPADTGRSAMEVVTWFNLHCNVNSWYIYKSIYRKTNQSHRSSANYDVIIFHSSLSLIPIPFKVKRTKRHSWKMYLGGRLL